jgi:hypothetical protein
LREGRERYSEPADKEDSMKFLPLALLFMAASAYGEIYTWTDARGAVHYTNRLDEIPVRHRARAKSLNYGAEAQPGAVSPQQIPAARPVEQLPPPAGGGTAKQGVPPPSMDSRPKEMRRQRMEEGERMKQKNHRSSRQLE